MTNWSDISTAPKDGEEFLAHDGMNCAVAWFGWDEAGEPVWLHGDYQRFDAKFWMPLPTPPGEDA